MPSVLQRMRMHISRKERKTREEEQDDQAHLLFSPVSVLDHPVSTIGDDDEQQDKDLDHHFELAEEFNVDDIIAIDDGAYSTASSPRHRSLLNAVAGQEAKEKQQGNDPVEKEEEEQLQDKEETNMMTVNQHEKKIDPEKPQNNPVTAPAISPSTAGLFFFMGQELASQIRSGPPAVAHDDSLNKNKKTGNKIHSFLGGGQLLGKDPTENEEDNDDDTFAAIPANGTEETELMDGDDSDSYDSSTMTVAKASPVLEKRNDSANNAYETPNRSESAEETFQKERSVRHETEDDEGAEQPFVSPAPSQHSFKSPAPSRQHSPSLEKEKEVEDNEHWNIPAVVTEDTVSESESVEAPVEEQREVSTEPVIPESPLEGAQTKNETTLANKEEEKEEIDEDHWNIPAVVTDDTEYEPVSAEDGSNVQSDAEDEDSYQTAEEEQQMPYHNYDMDVALALSYKIEVEEEEETPKKTNIQPKPEKEATQEPSSPDKSAASDELEPGKDPCPMNDTEYRNLQNQTVGKEEEYHDPASILALHSPRATIRRRSGVAKTRVAKDTLEAQEKQGWQGTIEAAASSTNLTWQSETGWEEYKDKHQPSQSVQLTGTVEKSNSTESQTEHLQLSFVEIDPKDIPSKEESVPTLILDDEEEDEEKGTETKEPVVPSSPSQAPLLEKSDESDSTIGMRVAIHKGSNKGKNAIVLGYKDSRTYRVKLYTSQWEATPHEVGVRIASVEEVVSDSYNENEFPKVNGPRKDNDPKVAVASTVAKSKRSGIKIDVGDSGSSAQDCPIDRVKVIKGVNKGKNGIVRGFKDKRTYLVALCTESWNLTGDEVGVRIASCTHVSDVDKPKKVTKVFRQPKCITPRGASDPYFSLQDSNAWVDLPAEENAHQNRSSLATRSALKDIGNQTIPEKRVRFRNKPFLFEPSENEIAAANWIAPSSDHTEQPQREFRVVKRRIVSAEDDEKEDITLLSTLFPNRISVDDLVLNKKSNQKKPPKQRRDADGSTHELISTKIYDDMENGNPYATSQVLRLFYVQTSGPGVPDLSLKDFLLNMCDFSMLNTRKVMSRFELLQSPAKFDVVFSVSCSSIQRIQDNGVYQGCGFISDGMMDKLCHEAGMDDREAELKVALQVRMIIPGIGFCKGMLMRKQISGGAEILIPESMVKVPPSSTVERKSATAVILINKNGMHPMKSSANDFIDRRLKEERKDPPYKSFKAKISKKLTPMITRLWESMSVPEDVCSSYTKQSLEPDHRNHAWVVGVSDPTDGQLPADSVYVPGLSRLFAPPSKIFVTRSPCVESSDGRLLTLITSQPKEMDDSQWEWLQRLPFGCIIFSNPREGKMSLPERIAEGDLDGDLYLICWEDAVLSHMVAPPLPELDMKDDGVLKVLEEPNENWFEDAQDLMIDVGARNGMQQLTGILYRLGEKTADQQGLSHPDAVSFFRAYKQALEFAKHGRPIMLPEPLHSKVNKNVRHLLSSTSTEKP